MVQLDFAAEHARVLAEANSVYTKRSQVRGQMWLDMPPSDKIRELRERADRLKAANDRLLSLGGADEFDKVEDDLIEAMISDAIDTINYAAFLVKQIRRGMRG